MCVDTVKNMTQIPKPLRGKRLPYEEKRSLKPFRGRRLHHKGRSGLFKMERRPQPPGGDGKEYKYAVIWPSKATSAQS